MGKLNLLCAQWTIFPHLQPWLGWLHEHVIKRSKGEEKSINKAHKQAHTWFLISREYNYFIVFASGESTARPAGSSPLCAPTLQSQSGAENSCWATQLSSNGCWNFVKAVSSLLAAFLAGVLYGPMLLYSPSTTLHPGTPQLWVISAV